MEQKILPVVEVLLVEDNQVVVEEMVLDTFVVWQDQLEEDTRDLGKITVDPTFSIEILVH